MQQGTRKTASADRHRVDPALVVRATSGEADAVQELWQSHRRWVAAIVLSHMPREADLDDLLQDIAATFVRSVQELRTPGALRPWLRTVAINAARAEGRKKTRRRNALESQAATDPGTFQRDETRIARGRRMLRERVAIERERQMGRSSASQQGAGDGGLDA